MGRNGAETTTNEIVVMHDIMVKHAIAQGLKTATGKHIKQTLTRLEACGMLTPDTRKHVLDGFNDLLREVTDLIIQSA